MYRDTWLDVNIDNLKFNIKHIKDNHQKKVIAVIKANGYGSGDAYIAKAAIEVGASMVAVSSLDEALILRNEGLTCPILILGYTSPKYMDILRQYDIATTVVSKEWAQKVAEEDCKDVKLHLKVDTGMNRIGIKDLDELKEVCDLLVKKGANVEGIFTHFACSDAADNVMNEKQFALFEKAVKSLNHEFTWIHCNNSDMSIRSHDTLSNADRLGIAMYGISAFDSQLKPVLSLYSRLVHVKTLMPGETIGYGATYTTTGEEIIGTIPIGYADGWIRKNQGRKCWVENEMAEFVGRICMDQCMLKMEHYHPVNSPVELFGDHIDLCQVATELDTIPYEIITLLSDRLTKCYYEHNEMVAEINPRLDRSYHK